MSEKLPNPKAKNSEPVKKAETAKILPPVQEKPFQEIIKIDTVAKIEEETLLSDKSLTDKQIAVSDNSSKERKKYIFELIIATLFGVILSSSGHYYESLQGYDEIKWEPGKPVCTEEECTITYFIYKFGRTSKNVSVIFKVKQPERFVILNEVKDEETDYSIPNVFKYERVLFGFSQTNVAGDGESPESKDLSASNYVRFKIDNLSHYYVYQLKLNIKFNDKNDIKNVYKIVKDPSLLWLRIKDSTGNDYRRNTGISLNDYLRLYGIEFLVTGILLIILVWLVWKININKRGVK